MIMQCLIIVLYFDFEGEKKDSMVTECTAINCNEQLTRTLSYMNQEFGVVLFLFFAMIQLKMSENE